MDGEERFSVKEVLMQMVLPQLKSIETGMVLKAEAAKVEALETKLDLKLEAQDEKIDSLKSWRNRLAGAFALVGIVLPIATAAIVYLLTR